ncbi:MAG: flagellar basal body-associated protein FliL [Holosporaceae bacterium]
MKKKAFIGGALMVLLAGGGFVAFQKMTPHPAATDEPKPVELTPAEKAATIKIPTFFKMDAFKLPVVRDGQVKDFLFVSITLELNDEKDIEKFARNKERLRNDVLDGLSQIASLPAHFNQLSEPAIKQKILDVTNKTLGEPLIKEVLVKNLIIQPVNYAAHPLKNQFEFGDSGGDMGSGKVAPTP